MKTKKIVVIGGGTGTVAVLSGLKHYPDLELSVIVNMTDDGGSNRIVRDEFGLLPLSDIRKSIIALSDDETKDHTLRNLFNYRFDKGEGLRGHTLGNLIMMALSDIKGGQLEAIAAASQIFDVSGRIVPVTLDLVKLTVEYDNGNIVQGEHFIDEPATENIDAKIAKLFVSPHAHANPQALQRLAEADFIVMGPGDLYTSTLANVIVDDIPRSIRESPARFILISNLMTKKGETHWMKASDLVAEVQKYCTREPDLVLMNNAKIPAAILAKYRQRKEYLIPDNLPESPQIMRADLISNLEVSKDKGDDLPRSLIRHDAGKLAKLLYRLFQEKE